MASLKRKHFKMKEKSCQKIPEKFYFALAIKVTHAGGTSPDVQWLRLCTSAAGAQVLPLVRELECHMPCGMAKKQKSYLCKHVYNRTLLLFNLFVLSGLGYMF